MTGRERGRSVITSAFWTATLLLFVVFPIPRVLGQERTSKEPDPMDRVIGTVALEGILFPDKPEHSGMSYSFAIDTSIDPSAATGGVTFVLSGEFNQDSTGAGSLQVRRYGVELRRERWGITAGAVDQRSLAYSLPLSPAAMATTDYGELLGGQITESVLPWHGVTLNVGSPSNTAGRIGVRGQLSLGLPRHGYTIPGTDSLYPFPVSVPVTASIPGVAGTERELRNLNYDGRVSAGDSMEETSLAMSAALLFEDFHVAGVYYRGLDPQVTPVYRVVNPETGNLGYPITPAVYDVDVTMQHYRLRALGVEGMGSFGSLEILGSAYAVGRERQTEGFLADLSSDSLESTVEWTMGTAASAAVRVEIGPLNGEVEFHGYFPAHTQDIVMPPFDRMAFTALAYRIGPMEPRIEMLVSLEDGSMALFPILPVSITTDFEVILRGAVYVGAEATEIGRYSEARHIAVLLVAHL